MKIQRTLSNLFYAAITLGLMAVSADADPSANTGKSWQMASLSPTYQRPARDQFPKSRIVEAPRTINPLNEIVETVDRNTRFEIGKGATLQVGDKLTFTLKN